MRTWTRQSRLKKLKQWPKCSGPLEVVCLIIASNMGMLQEIYASSQAQRPSCPLHYDLPQAMQARLTILLFAGNKEAKASTSAGLSNIDAAMAELDMEHYDDEDDNVPGLFGTGKHPGMAYHSRAEDDPYLDKEISDSDDEELVLKKSDFLILAARNEDDVSHLEVCDTNFSMVHVFASPHRITIGIETGGGDV